MSAVIDRSILEVFIDGGAEAATVSFYPTQPLTSLAVSTANIQDSMEVSVGVYAVQSAWAQYENEQGTVFGNVTESGN
jgi:beta-fructofuranosidase